MTTPYAWTSNGVRSVRLHRHLMEQHIGRKLKRCEHVHHINENKRDNRIENLEVLMIGAHMHLHHTKYPFEFVCKQCGKTFKPRPGHRGRHPKFCNKKCSGLFRQGKKMPELRIALAALCS